MRAFGVLVALCLAMIVGTSSARSQSGPDNAADLRSLVAEAAENLQVSSAILSVIDGDSEKVLGYGVADEAASTAMTPDTRILIASITKTFTAATVLTLAQEGALDLDAPANTYLKRVTLPDWKGKPITVRHLITHRAGLGNQSWGVIAREPVNAPVSAEFAQARIPDAVREPGESIVYSNVGFALAGMVVEDVTGKTLASVMEEKLLRPLDMASTTLNYALDPALAAPSPFARAYRTGESWIALPFDANTPFMAPAGSIITTGNDMLNWLRFVVSDDPVALALRSEQARNFIKGRAISNGAWLSDLNGVTIVSHTGAFSGYTSYFAVSPDTGRGAFLATAGMPSEGTGFAAYSAGAKAVNFFVAGREPGRVEPEAFSDAGALAGTYLPARRFYRGIGKFFSLQNPMQVSAKGGFLYVNGDGPFGKVRDGVLAKQGDQLKLYGYDLTGDQPRLLMNADTAERAGPLENVLNLQIILGVSVLLILTATIWASIAKPRRPLVTGAALVIVIALTAVLMGTDVFRAMFAGEALLIRLVNILAWLAIGCFVFHLLRFKKDRRGPWITGALGLAGLSVFLIFSGLADPALT